MRINWQLPDIQHVNAVAFTLNVQAFAQYDAPLDAPFSHAHTRLMDLDLARTPAPGAGEK